MQRRAGVIKTEEQVVYRECQEIRLRLFFIFIIYMVINFSLNTTAHLKKKKKKKTNLLFFAMIVHLLQVVKPLNISPLGLTKLVNILQKQLGLEGVFH
jgi:hypothetical protein